MVGNLLKQLQLSTQADAVVFRWAQFVSQQRHLLAQTCNQLFTSKTEKCEEFLLTLQWNE